MWFEFVLLPDSRHSAGMNSLLLGQLSRGPMCLPCRLGVKGGFDDSLS